MRTTTIGGGMLAALVLTGAIAAPASAISDSNADLSVLHAVPDTPVDVYVNGENTLDDFQPGDLAGPLDLPAGSYEIAITAADAENANDPVIGPITVELAANTSYTAAAHLGEDGSPTATLFTNDLSATAAGEGRLTVRHTAAAPAVDVLAGGEAVVSNLSNPDEQVLDLPAGTVSASVAATGTTEPVIGPADIAIEDGVNTIVYATGSLEDDNLDLAIQTIDGLHSNPGGVNSGQAGLVAGQDPLMPAALAGGFALLLAAAAAFGVRTARVARARR